MSPSKMNIIAIAVGSIFFCVVVTPSVILVFKEPSGDLICSLILLAMYAGMLSPLIGIGLWSTFVVDIPAESFLLGKRDEIIEVFPNHTELWRWDKRRKQTSVISYKSKTHSVSMELSPIAENPKVRNLVYCVTAESLGNPEDYFNYQKTIGQKNLQAWLKFWLYEFNERHGREIAAFFNPLDEKQQASFQTLIGDSLKPQLKDSGVWFVNASFNLA